jgi:hypothetical protein
MNETAIKPFGYVLKSQMSGTEFPWCNPHKWSDGLNCSGNMRRYVSHAQVFKRVPRGYPALTVVPVYSDPKNTGIFSLYEETRQCLKTGCEKCGQTTTIEVKVMDRWAAWCGC